MIRYPGPPQQDPTGERSRDLIERALRGAPGHFDPQSATPEGLFRGIRQFAANEGWVFNWDAGLIYWWDLCRLGAIAIVGGGDNGVVGGCPRAMVTPLGLRLLKQKDASPHNGERFLAAVRLRVRQPADPIVMAYLDEAAGAWRSDLNRSSIVMLGCACERLVVLLAEALRDAADAVEPYSTDLRKTLAAPRPAGILAIFEKVREGLGCAKLPPLLADAIDLKLTPIFERARGLRNQHGHPTSAEVSAEEAHAGLLLFPGFYDFADRVCAHLAERN